MSKNYMEEIAKMLHIELNSTYELYGQDNYFGKVFLDSKGAHFCTSPLNDYSMISSAAILEGLLIGSFELKEDK